MSKWLSFATASWSSLACEGPLKSIYSTLPAVGSPMELGTLMQALKITAIHVGLELNVIPLKEITHGYILQIISNSQIYHLEEKTQPLFQ